MSDKPSGPLDYIEDVPPLRRQVSWMRDALLAIRAELNQAPAEATHLVAVIDRMIKTALEHPPGSYYQLHRKIEVRDAAIARLREEIKRLSEPPESMRKRREIIRAQVAQGAKDLGPELARIESVLCECDLNDVMRFGYSVTCPMHGTDRNG